MKFKINFTLNYAKTRPIHSGYRPTWTGANKPEHNSGMISWEGNAIQLGENREVLLCPLFEELWLNIQINDILKCMEGSKQVGEAIVLEIL